MVVPKSTSITAARVYAGLSMRQLASKSALNIATISKMESGTCPSVAPQTAKRVCDALGMLFNELFELKTAL